MDIRYVINLVTDDLRLINKAITVPSNWVIIPKKSTTGTHLKVKYMALEGQGAEDKLLIDDLAEKRIVAPTDWPQHLFRILGKAFTWHEAQQMVSVMMGGNENFNNDQ